MTWTAADVPDQHGRVFVVTGANSGIGYEATFVLASRGAHVVMACRDATRANDAANRIRAEHPEARLEVASLDLADLSSVRAFATDFLDTHDRLDVLVNNAGVMAIPRRETADGFEMQLGTNHLGHFALTGLLLERLLETEGARIVHVSSMAHAFGKMFFDDLMAERSYERWSRYGQSKLANLLFHHELQRRLEKSDASAISVACHPGYSATNLQLVGPKMDGSAVMTWLSRLANDVVAQDAHTGSLPTLFAATSPAVQGGDFIGPSGFASMWGPPVVARPRNHARDANAQLRLWDVSTELTGVTFEAL